MRVGKKIQLGYYNHSQYTSCKLHDSDLDKSATWPSFHVTVERVERVH